MPAPSNLPSERVTIRFPPVKDVEESYQLLELPPEVLAAVEGGAVVPLTIKGRPNDDAVLCTQDKTYTLRSVAISNSLLVLRPPTSSSAGDDATPPTLQIRDVCHEVLECVPAAGRVERVRAVLKESAWTGIDKERAGGEGRKKRKRAKRYTRAQLESIIQASEDELSAAIKENNIVEVDGDMLLLPEAELGALLALVLALITVHASSSLSGSSVPVSVCAVAEALSEDHEVPSDLSRGVMGLFGTIDGDTWDADVQAMVRELGRGLLVQLEEPHPVDEFMIRWHQASTDDWSQHADITLLKGEYLLTDPPPSTFAQAGPLLSYFPAHSLPAHPPTRFADLFLTRPRWRPDDMAPFLRGLYREGDSKARDKLIAKFVRVVKEKDGSWWYPRRTG